MQVKIGRPHSIDGSFQTKLGYENKNDQGHTCLNFCHKNGQKFQGHPGVVLISIVWENQTTGLFQLSAGVWDLKIEWRKKEAIERGPEGETNKS